MMTVSKKSLHHNWRAFEEARVFVHSLKLKDSHEWQIWSKSKARPNDIPVGPSRIYKDEGWKGWGDWLGTKHRRGGYRPFKEARAFVHSLELSNKDEWSKWTKSNDRPYDIPVGPARIYKNMGWAGWGDWLGTGRIAKQNMHYRSFEESRAVIHKLGLQNRSEWKKWVKSDAHPSDIPAHPNEVYKDKGWVGWGDWLGTGRIANQNMIYRPFKEARAFARSLGLQNQDQWKKWVKSDAYLSDIPMSPNAVYVNKGWISWSDWLGTRNRRGGFRSFEEARKYVRDLGLKDTSDWKKWSQSEARPDDIPANPAKVYEGKGWTVWSDWLGSRRRRGSHQTFEDARAFVRNLGLHNQDEWGEWAQSNSRPIDIPAYPDAVYKNKGWKSWGDWLGTDRIANQNMLYRPFQEAREFVHGLSFLNQDEWSIWAKSNERPHDIPANPRSVYDDKGWISMGDWLGTGRIASQFMIYRSFREARKFVRSLGLKNQDEWGKWAQSEARPEDIPAGPERTYKDKGWAGMGDWLGVFNRWNKNAILSFLYSIKPVLLDLQPAELYAIMRQNGLIVSANTKQQNAGRCRSRWCYSTRRTRLPREDVQAGT